ncbi:hypothetical protein G3576_04580 [Roseomonas stagni]|uniref:DUF1772 domain-containing protein n=1 Tax=Falsiroseomonas algicola TaxID=2716930 RepID=A0A6M1LH11_9PROT|nr:hypothetical protein [Falsiroseomonas algicola]NGM19279.1 hypothetical protein [Falsiroseomonas algicola]
MGLHWARLGVVGLLVLALAGPVGHVLEAPGKWNLPPDVWLTVQQRLYAGTATIGVIGYVAAPLACLGLAWWRRGTEEGHVALLATLLVFAAFMTWWVVVAPVNALVAGARLGAIPPDWVNWRRQWHAGHGACALLVATALALQVNALISPPARPRAA